MMEKFKLNAFCCCSTLRTGSLVIGTLGWILTIFQLFYLTSPIKKANRHGKEEEDIAGEIAYSVLTLIVCIALVWGVYKNNRRFILPWLVLKCIECIAWTIITFLIFILFFYVEEILLLIFLFFVIFFATTLSWYFWLCVWSLYQDMTEDMGEILPMNQIMPISGTVVVYEKEKENNEFEDNKYPIESV